MYIIFAPHIDDETIGCFTYLKNNLIKSIYYFFDITDERKKEAYTLRDKLNSNYNIYFTNINELLILDKEDIILVPNINDTHPQHKLVNLYAKKNYKNTKLFYSIDMNVRKNVLDEKLRKEKKDLLEIFSSQHKLLNSDEKYFLFESVLTTDNIERYEFTHYIRDDVFYIFSSNCSKTIDYLMNNIINDNNIENINDIIYRNVHPDCEYIEYTFTYFNTKEYIKFLF